MVPSLQYNRPRIEDFDLIGDITYPTLFHLGDLLSKWKAFDTSPKKWNESVAYPNGNHGLRRFNFSDINERRISQLYREREVPFILYDVKSLDTAAEHHFSLKALKNNFGSIRRPAEKSTNGYHFMYYSAKHLSSTLALYPTWKPPQEDILISFSDFLMEASEVEALKSANPSEALSKPLIYMTISAKEVILPIFCNI